MKRQDKRKIEPKLCFCIGMVALFYSLGTQNLQALEKVRAFSLKSNETSDQDLTVEEARMSLGSELEAAIKKGKPDIRIKVLKKRGDAGQIPYLILVEERNDLPPTMESLAEIKEKSIFVKQLIAKAHLKWRVLNGLAKSMAVILTIRQAYQLIHFDSYRKIRLNEYLSKRLRGEEAGIIKNDVLKYVRREKDMILGSLAYSTYILSGHILKSIFRDSLPFAAIFPLEGLTFRSEVENLASQIRENVEKGEFDLAGSLTLLVDESYFVSVVDHLRNDGYDEIIFPKFDELATWDEEEPFL